MPRNEGNLPRFDPPLPRNEGTFPQKEETLPPGEGNFLQKEGMLPQKDPREDRNEGMLEVLAATPDLFRGAKRLVTGATAHLAIAAMRSENGWVKIIFEQVF